MSYVLLVNSSISSSAHARAHVRIAYEGSFKGLSDIRKSSVAVRKVHGCRIAYPEPATSFVDATFEELFDKLFESCL